MPRSRKSQDQWKKGKRKHQWDKEKPLSFLNTYAITDLTPYNAIRLMRNEPEKTEYASSSRIGVNIKSTIIRGIKAMEKAMAGVRLNSKEKGTLEKEAKKRKMTLSSFFKEAATFYLALDPKILEMIKEFAHNLKTEPAYVYQNMLIHRLAELDARKEAQIEVFGFSEHFLLPEFMLTDRGIVSGKELYQDLRKLYKDQFVKEYRKDVASNK